MFATAFALLISFSVSVALVSWAAPITAQAISLDVQKSIDGWQLRQTLSDALHREPK
ncbi:hypothetical protein [Mesorhizobium sp. B2-4-13]|uniref:hypothetical protein n=1 Tax=Mesorhizobium sp. B2-4-13 TaxID=2589936 RepID=UPI0015EE6FFD|nr:hypothetical protein [Mesorhizobium sp. B2-4-13]